MEGDDPICFWRGNCSDFTDPNPEFKWYGFTNDLSLGDVEESW